MAASHTIPYTYGADGLRRSSTVDGNPTTFYVYDGQTMVREMKRNGQGTLVPTATYLPGPRGMEYGATDNLL